MDELDVLDTKVEVVPNLEVTEPAESEPNHVTLFSNGMGHFIRHTKVKPGEPQKITIPFKQDHLSDAATSLNVFGKVRLTVPPCFTPVNAQITSLQIDRKNAMRSILENLSGAEIELVTPGDQGKEIYTLLGIEQPKAVSPNNVGFGYGEAVVDYVVLMNADGVVMRRALNDISGIKFLDETIRSEVNKALRKNFQQIKPDSAFVDLQLESLDESEQEATISYTVPVAAWKMRYSIRQEGDAFWLEGAVVVDNNTDEDWKDFLVSVVTGEPISFTTDIATIKIPIRRMVNLVDAHALGNVGSINQAGMECAGAAPTRSKGILLKSAIACCDSASYTQSQMRNSANFGMAQDEDYETPGVADLATYDGVETKEVGDFCVFTSKSTISVDSKKSAVVPMFNVKLATAGVICFYKESNHPRRPFRAIKFKNQEKFTLGKGKVVIYNDGVFSGEAVLETLKMGENQILPHCLENSLRIIKEVGANGSVLTSVNIGKQYAVQNWLRTAETRYVIENKRDEPFNVVLEHNFALGATSEFVCTGPKIEETDRPAGQSMVRLYFKVFANEKITLTISEKIADARQYHLTGSNFQWIEQNILLNTTLADNEQMKACIEIHRQIVENEKKLNILYTEKTKLEQQSERIRKNMGAIKSTGADSVKSWIDDLTASERKIRNIEETLVPALDNEVTRLQDALDAKIDSLIISWRPKNETQVLSFPEHGDFAPAGDFRATSCRPSDEHTLE